MANRIVESRNSPIVAQNSSVALTSGVATSPPCSRLFLYMSSGPGDLTIRTLDGNSVTISALASGTLFNVNVQFDKATWSGTATATGFFTE